MRKKLNLLFGLVLIISMIALIGSSVPPDVSQPLLWSSKSVLLCLSV